jgi:hypothetical protein
MCGHGHHRHGHGRGAGFRGFGRRGFPPREEWLDRLQAYREQLEDELKNVEELIERLGTGPEAPQEASFV